MNFFNFDIKKALLILFLLITPLFLMTLERSKTEGNFVFRSLMFVNHGLKRAYHSTVSSFKNTADTYLNLIHIKKNNRVLGKKNQELKARLALMKEVQEENKRLKTVLRFQQNQPTRFIPAQVIGRDPVSEYQLLTVNRGKAQGVKKYMLVINEKGVVGYVFRTLWRSAQVILLTDPHSAIPAVIQRSRVYGIAEGGPVEDQCQLKRLKRRDDVKEGDTVVTSGLNALAPGGFPIGSVSKITKHPYGLTQEVTLTPSINPSNLEEVFIVQKDPSQKESF